MTSDVSLQALLSKLDRFVRRRLHLSQGTEGLWRDEKRHLPGLLSKLRP